MLAHTVSLGKQLPLIMAFVPGFYPFLQPGKRKHRNRLGREGAWPSGEAQGLNGVKQEWAWALKLQPRSLGLKSKMSFISKLRSQGAQSLLKLMSIESVIPSSYLILCRPLLVMPSIFPNTRVFSKESVLCISHSKNWSFIFIISPSNEHPGGFISGLSILFCWSIFLSLCQYHPVLMTVAL